MEINTSEPSSPDGAASSDSCALTRPYEGAQEDSSRKRQRLSSSDSSPSRSINVISSPRSEVPFSADTTITMSSPTVDQDLLPSRTPTRETSSPELHSSKVTLNLKQSAASKARSQTLDPSSTMNIDSTSVTEDACVSESQRSISRVRTFSVSSSITSSSNSPRILLIEDDDSEVNEVESEIVMVGDDEVEIMVDHVQSFPRFNQRDRSNPLVALRKFVWQWQYADNVEFECFSSVEDWIVDILNDESFQSSFWLAQYQDNEDFWKAFPCLIDALNERSVYFPSWMKERRGHHMMSHFFLRFAQLTARIIDMEDQALSCSTSLNDARKIVNMASGHFLRRFAQLLNQNGSPGIGLNLERHYGWDWKHECDNMLHDFQIYGGSVSNLASIAEACYQALPTMPTLVDIITDISRLVQKLVYKAVISMRNLKRSPDHRIQSTCEKVLAQSFIYFKVISCCFNQTIDKHITLLTVEAVTAQIDCLHELLYSLHGFGTASDLIPVHIYENRYRTLPSEHCYTAACIDWKFRILHKLLVSSQMQLRVCAISIVCNELIALFTKNKTTTILNDGKGPCNELLQPTADLLLELKLVDYIVGIGSHPELIISSGSIVNFLVLTGAYTDRQTDMIWDTIKNSQNPQVVDATIRMVLDFVAQLSCHELLYICAKLQALPLASFTSRMRELCHAVVHTLVRMRDQRDAQVRSIDSPPYELLIQLIRKSSTVCVKAFAALKSLQHFAIGTLNEILQWGPSLARRREMCIDCLSDISKSSPTAAGSICVLFVLTSSKRHGSELLYWLLMEHDCALSVVAEIEAFSRARCISDVSVHTNDPVQQARRDLLQMIIIQQPASLNAELGRRLWTSLVGDPKVPITSRETAWLMLNNVATETGSNNAYIKSCFQHYLPGLDRMCYCQGTLDFARTTVVDAMVKKPDMSIDSCISACEEAFEVVWQIVLTTPPNTVEVEANQLLAQLYLEFNKINHLSNTDKARNSLQVVRRCLHQLACSAHAIFQSPGHEHIPIDEDDKMQVSHPLAEIQDNLRFTRTLMFLKEFLRTHHVPDESTNRYRPPSITTKQVTLIGEIVEIQYQAFCKEGGNILKIRVGLANSLESLYTMIAHETGFTSFRLFHPGKEIMFTAKTLSLTVEQLRLHTSLLLVRSDNIAEETSVNLPTLEQEIVAHLDDFWKYLGMDGQFAKEIYQFLISFPVYQNVIDSFQMSDDSTNEIFIVGQPYKSMYAVYTLREHLATGLRYKTLQRPALVNAVDSIVAAIKRSELYDACTNTSLKALLLQQFSDYLTQLLKNLPQDGNDILSLDEKMFFRVTELLETMQNIPNSHDSLLTSLFEMLLQACKHSKVFRKAFETYAGLEELFSNLILQNDRISLRKANAKLIEETCEADQSFADTSACGLTQLFWKVSVGLVPKTLSYATHSKEFLNVVLVVARKMLATAAIEQSELYQLLIQWGALLNTLSVEQDIAAPNRPSSLAMGLVSLVRWCSEKVLMSRDDHALRSISTGLMEKHLFPEVSVRESADVRRDLVPILHPGTRKLMYDVVINLTRTDMESLQAILVKLRNLLPYDTTSPETPYTLELPYNFERAKAIRSGTGYVGLRNLSNTCYLNSLVAQLFMNVTFRKSMLNLHVADAGTSQKLLAETQCLFSHMQNAYQRFVDPYDFAMSIRTYDETAIDVNVQMDVDEFYNLLFDRWEGQVLSSTDKQAFRSIYGGQLVQQVKSEECPHISERLEPFSAIQCDIKGKSTLQESLQAYVDGEVMEGDNKYKCSTCDKHVNAVKRACLKDIPNNLIFHLKRFDFNLRTLQRNKINDYFSFPLSIDMRPYKVEHLMNTGEDVAEDSFELVGILVHSGTAESGHYYSYVRERPSTTNAWFEFNDDVVSTFDPSLIESHCYGGTEGSDSSSATTSFEKPWSAYMLFYERSSTIEEKQNILIKTQRPAPMRVGIPDHFSAIIAEENEALIKLYTLHDDYHAPFVLRICDNLYHLNAGTCSQEHSTEQFAMATMMLHLDQVVARKKDIPDFSAYFDYLNRRLDDCAECSVDFANWICEHKEAFRLLFIKNPDSGVRNAIRQLTFISLTRIKSGPANYAYGAYIDPGDDAEANVFPKLVETLQYLWHGIPLASKAWPDYFTLLTAIVDLGTAETGHILDANFLLNTLDIIRAEPRISGLQPQYVRMLQIFAKRNAPIKSASYEEIIEFLFKLLCLCNLHSEIRNDERRAGTVTDNDKYPLNRLERTRLTEYYTNDNTNTLVAALLRINQNVGVTQDIIAVLLEELPDITDGIFYAITVGLQDAETPSPDPYLAAAFTFCKGCHTKIAVVELLQCIAQAARVCNTCDCLAYISFFERIFELYPCRSGLSAIAIQQRVMEFTTTWAPVLLLKNQSSVRNAAEDYVIGYLFNHETAGDDDLSGDDRRHREFIVRTIRDLGISCLKLLQNALQHNHVRSNYQVVYAVIERCKGFYDDADIDRSGATKTFSDLYNLVTKGLGTLLITDDAEGGDSDWNNNSGASGSDEAEEPEDQEYFSQF